MGQRLTVAFKKDGETILTTYQQWGGFTQPAINFVSDIAKGMAKHLGSDIEDFMYTVDGLQNKFTPQDLAKIVYNVKGAKLDQNNAEQLGIEFEECDTDVWVKVDTNEMRDDIRFSDNAITVDLNTLTMNVNDIFYINSTDGGEDYDDGYDLTELDNSYDTSEMSLYDVTVFRNDLDNNSGYEGFMSDDVDYIFIQ